MVIIGLVGKRGVGKTEFRDYVVNHYPFYAYLTSRDIIRLYGLKGGLIGRTTILTKRKSGKLRIRLEREYGEDFIAKEIARSIISKMPQRIIVDSVWRIKELTFYKQVLGKNFVLVGILSDEEIRYRRLIRTQQEKNYEQFKIWGNVVKEGQIDALFKKVKYKIVNNGSTKEFYEEIDSLINLISKHPIDS